MRDMGSIPGLGRSLGVGNGNALQYSCLENHRRLRVNFGIFTHQRIPWAGGLQSMGPQRVRHD